MKKILSVVLAIAMIASIMALGSSAIESAYDVPKAAAAPKIDGVIDANEWANALAVPVDSDNLNWVLSNADSSLSAGSVIYMMWDETALYVAANILDTTLSSDQPGSGEALNKGDTVQLCFFADEGASNGSGSSNLFWDFTPWTDDGHDPATAESYEHFAAADTTAVDLKSTVNGSAYTLEFALKWSDFGTYVPDYEAQYKGAAGTQMIIELCVIDTDTDGAQSLGYVADAWCDPASTPVYTLTNAAAGAAPAAAEPAAEEVPEAAAPVVIAPAAQTADMLSVAAAVAIIAFGGYIASKNH